MALDNEQRRILRQILHEGRNIRDPRTRRVYERAAVQTGLVESGLRNLNYGDADSQGWRQERQSIYANPTNVKASVRRFRQEFQQFYDPGEKSYEVAAQVQRPAEKFRGRYHDVAGQAAQILKGVGADRGGSQAPSSNGTTVTSTPTRDPFSAGQAVDLSSIIQGLQARPERPTATAPVAPAFSATNSLPMAGTPVVSNWQPPQKQNLSGILDAIRTVGQELPESQPQTQQQTQSQGSVQGSTPGGGPVKGPHEPRVAVAPGADRAGVSTKPAVFRFVEEVSSISGRRVKIGTGTNHSRLTVNGNVSDHWGGNAADIPATGNRLIALGRAALIAAGMSPKRARKQTGGLFNVNGKQIIFNTHEGGDHTNHLHVGL